MIEEQNVTNIFFCIYKIKLILLRFKMSDYQKWYFEQRYYLMGINLENVIFLTFA